MLVATPTTGLALKAKLFRGFADPSRLSLLEALRDGERSVGDLMTATGLSQSNASNHLACLADCGLVAREQRGRRAFYRLSDPRVANLLGTADAVLADVARGVAACLRYDAPLAGQENERCAPDPR